jgi:hypothetical protein
VLLPQSVQTAPASTQRVVVIGGDISQGVERLGSKADLPPPYVVGVNERSIASIVHVTSRHAQVEHGLKKV